MIHMIRDPRDRYEASLALWPEGKMRADFERLWGKPIAQQHVELRAQGAKLSAEVLARTKTMPSPANDNKAGTKRPDQEPIDAETLLGMDFPPVDYVVQD